MTPAVTLHAMRLGLSAVGLDADTLFETAGVDPALGVADFTAVPDEALYRLWRAAFEADPRPELPARVGMAVPFGAFGVADYLVGTADDLASGLRGLSERFSLVSPVGRLDLSVGRVRLVYDQPSSFRFVSEPFTLGVIVGRFRSVLPSPPVRVCLAEPDSGPTDGFSEAFGAPTVLGSEHAEILFAAGSWTAPLGLADPMLNQTLAALAPHATPQSDVSPETTRRVRDHLEDALPRGEVTVGATARALGMSVRTLQRQLATESTTYAEVVERTRRSAASRLLDVGVSVQEVASRLGYAEPTSFTRAYRRWHGHPPSKR